MAIFVYPPRTENQASRLWHRVANATRSEHSCATRRTVGNRAWNLSRQAGIAFGGTIGYISKFTIFANIHRAECKQSTVFPSAVYLSQHEVDELYGLPCFTDEDRQV